MLEPMNGHPFNVSQNVAFVDSNQQLTAWGGYGSSNSRVAVFGSRLAFVKADVKESEDETRMAIPSIKFLTTASSSSMEAILLKLKRKKAALHDIAFIVNID